MPETLLEQIDEERKQEKFKPSRSAWIVAELTAAVARSRKVRGIGITKPFGAAGENPVAPADGLSTPSTPRFSPDALRLNEEPPTTGPRARSTRGLKTIIGREKGKPAS